MKTEKSKILITGANGQLGWELQKALSEYELVLTDKTLNPKSQITNNKQIQNSNVLNSKFIPKSIFYDLDITNVEKVHHVFNKEKPDFVVHAAAYTNVDGAEDAPETAFEVNRDGSHNVAEACREIGAKLIAISTDYVFDGESEKIYCETDIPNPQSVYGESKLAGEIQTMLKCPEAIILRTAWLYGGEPVTNSKLQITKNEQTQNSKSKIPNYPDPENGIYKNFPNTMLNLAMQGKELRVVDDQFGCPTYAGDLAGAIKQIIEKGGIEPGIYHAVNTGFTSWYEFAKLIIVSLSTKLQIPNNKQIQNLVQPCKSDVYKTKAKRPKNSVLSTGKLKSVGIGLPSWEEGLKRFLIFDNK